MASKGWQHPYVNIFKHVRVEAWKKSSKEGDVSTYTDKTLKCSVFRIRGIVPASSFILIPPSSHQSLGLTGRFFYLLFRPTPGKYFMVQMDVAAEDGQVVRISFSNMFKEFKSTATSLQFPFLCGAAEDSIYGGTVKSARLGLVGPAPTRVRWTCLMLDLRHTLSACLNRCYSHLKSIKLCSNMSVKNMCTSDLQFNPGVSFSEAKLKGLASSLGTRPIPRDLAFPVPKGHNWHDLYDYIRFPSEGATLPFDSTQKANPRLEAKSGASHTSPMRGRVRLSKPVQDRVSLVKHITSPKPVLSRQPSVVPSLPALGLVTNQKSVVSLCHDDNDDDDPQRRTALSSTHQPALRSPWGTADGGVHVYVHPEEGVGMDTDSSEEEIIYSLIPHPVNVSLSEEPKEQKLLPDPILRLSRIIGFGGATTRCALWTKSGDTVVYPCHAIIVSMKISSKEQRFFIGHTDKVSALAFSGDTTVLASAQTGPDCVVRIWNYHIGDCLAIFRSHARSIISLSFSYSGRILCGAGRDSYSKTMVVIWNTANVTKGGEVAVLARTHTDVDIHTMKVAVFDETRMVSCGRDNIRLWRVRNRTLRSCPVALGEYHSMDFTDVAFEERNSSHHNLDDRTLYASSRSGHIFEIDYSRVVVKDVRRLLPAQVWPTDRKKWTMNTDQSIAINSISVSSSFCATGSEDGFLRLWPLDFSSVFLEAEHEGPVSLVSISSDSLQVLAATSTGNLGFLDVSSRGYSTLMRSHADTVLGFGVDGIRRHLTTASSDGTVRIWNMDSLDQLYDFVSEDVPCSVAFHPSEQVFSCGFSSGIVRVFDIPSAKLLAEHRQHRGDVVGLLFSPDGDSMYSAGAEGSLARYDSSEDEHNVVKVVCNVVAGATVRAPEALTVSSDSRCLAFVGPSDYVVTVADALSLDELLHVDVSILDVDSPRLDSALKVCFSSASTQHLLIATSANKVLWVCAQTGRLLRQVSQVHKHQCSSLAVSEDSRFLLTAGHTVVKVWDYDMKLRVNAQMFIGHSQPISQVSFTPDQLGVISVGDAIFLWNFLAHPVKYLPERCSLPRLKHLLNPYSSMSVHPEAVSDGQLSSGVPRKTVPLPFSPPPKFDISTVDQAEPGGSLLLCEETSSIQVPDAGSGFSSDPRPAESFLRVTELVDATQLQTRHRDTELKRKKAVRPECYRHFIPRLKTSSLDQAAVAPQSGEECVKLKAVIGYNGNGRGNLVWSPEQGLFAYSCGCVVVVESLDTGCQRHLHGHSEEISCLAITNDAQTVASAAGGSGDNKSLICIWDVQSGACRKTISYHKGAVQSLAFSWDCSLFLSIGDFSEPDVALWSCTTFQMLSCVSVSGSIHDAAFSPSAGSQLACVGSRGIYFGLVHSREPDMDLKLQRVRAPAEVGHVHLTALCYHMDSLLFTATNRGHVCVWNVDTRSCFMSWEADEGEIGVLLCRGNRLLTGSSTHWLRLWEVKAFCHVQPQEKVSSSEMSGSRVMLQQEMKLDGEMVSAAFDGAMDMGMVGTMAGTLWYISWSDSSSIRLVSGHKTKVNDVVFSADERHFATCSEDGSVRVWFTRTLELVVQFHVLSQSCGCVCWSPRSRKDVCVAAGYSDGTLRIFRLSSSEMEMKLHPHRVAVTATQYSAHGHVILSAGRNGLVAVSNLVNGNTLRVLGDHRGAPITTIQCIHEECETFGLQGNELWLAASADRRVSVWAADWFKNKCDLLDWLSLPAPAYCEDASPPPSLAAFCPADPSLLVYAGYGVDKELSFYSLLKKQIIKKIALPHWATCLSLCPRSQLIAVGSRERVLKLITSTSGRFQDFPRHSDSLHTCHFSPSGKFLFTVAYDEILLWEVRGL